MRFNKKDYEKAEQFFNGETKWRDTWAEQSPSKDYEAFTTKRAGELMKAGVEEGVEQTKKKRTFLDDGDDWETFQKIEEQQKFVKMSVADWGKVRKLLLEAAEDDLILTKYSDKHVLPPFRAWDIANLLCDIEVAEVKRHDD